MTRRLFSFAAVCSLFFTAVACAGGGQNEHGGGSTASDHSLSATQVCGTAGLPKRAAEAVEEITGEKKFAEDPEGADPQLAANTLSTIYKPGQSTDWQNEEKDGRACIVDAYNGMPRELVISFSIVVKAPKASADDEGGVYRIGENAASSFPLGAYLYFHCVSDKLTGSVDDKPLVRAELMNNIALSDRPKSSAGKLRLQREQLVLLNSVAYVVAKDLGCADEGGLRSTANIRLVVEHGASPAPTVASSR